VTRERIVGFLLGISVGTAVGFYLRPPETVRSDGSDVTADNADYVTFHGSGSVSDPLPIPPRAKKEGPNSPGGACSGRGKKLKKLEIANRC